MVLLLVGVAGATLQYLGPPPAAPTVAAATPAKPEETGAHQAGAAKPASDQAAEAGAKTSSPSGEAGRVAQPNAADTATAQEPAAPGTSAPLTQTQVAPASHEAPTGQVRLQPVPPVVQPSANPIAPPDPALMEDSPHYNDVSLPRIGKDDRLPMQVYAAAAFATPGQPRVALLIDGIGLSQGDSRDAIANLPAAVSLAVSAYAPHVDALLDAARTAGHELLISVPMEPEGYPLNDEGFRALLTSADPPVNQRNLEWILSRFNGYIGATNASDGLSGERYSQSGQGFAEMGDELARRGLLFIDARPGATLQPDLAGRAIDLLLDDPPTALDIDQKLASLETMARDHGSAVGLAGPPSPVLVERIAAWLHGLQERGVSLVPVSALAAPAREKPPAPSPPEAPGAAAEKAPEGKSGEAKPAEGKAE